MEAVAAGGSAVGAIGALIQGQSQAGSLKYNAEVQENNAKAALLSAKLNADKQSLQFNKTQGQAVAGFGASGVEGDSGSVLAVLGANAANAELDRQNIIYGGQVRQINYENQASLDSFGAQSALNGSYLSALGGLAKGGAQIAGSMSGGGAGGGGGTNAGSFDIDPDTYQNSLGKYDYGSP